MIYPQAETQKTLDQNRRLRALRLNQQHQYPTTNTPTNPTPTAPSSSSSSSSSSSGESAYARCRASANEVRATQYFLPRGMASVYPEHIMFRAYARPLDRHGVGPLLLHDPPPPPPPVVTSGGLCIGFRDRDRLGPFNPLAGEPSFGGGAGAGCGVVWGGGREGGGGPASSGLVLPRGTPNPYNPYGMGSAAASF